MADRVKSYLMIAFSVVVIGLILYNIYTGATVREIGIPGIFTITFGPKPSPTGTDRDAVGKSGKARSPDHSELTGADPSGAYPRDLNISGSATAGDYSFKVLSARLVEYGQVEATHTKTLLLRLGIRETYNGKFAGTGYFMPDGFRLVLDDVVVSPKDCPIQNIDRGTSQDGSVTFILPETAQHVTLRVGYYDGQRSDIPLALSTK